MERAVTLRGLQGGRPAGGVPGGGGVAGTVGARGLPASLAARGARPTGPPLLAVLPEAAELASAMLRREPAARPAATAVRTEALAQRARYLARYPECPASAEAVTEPGLVLSDA